MTPANSVTVGPNKRKQVAFMVMNCLLFTGAVALVAFCLFGLAWFKASGWILVVVCAVLMACASIPTLVASIFKGRPSVGIGPEGFVARFPVGQRARNFSDIEGDFEVVNARVGFGVNVVAYRLTPAFKEANGIKPSPVYPGYDEAIVALLERPAAEVAELLNDRKRRAAGAV
jgi:hypothetical protein